MSDAVVWDDRCQEVLDYVKQQMPVRVRLAGDGIAKGIICLAVQDWPSKELLECAGDSRQSALLTASTARWVTRTLRDSDKNVGSLMSLLLPVLVSAIVEVILRWWSSDKRHQRMVSQVQSRAGRRKR